MPKVEQIAANAGKYPGAGGLFSVEKPVGAERTPSSPTVTPFSSPRHRPHLVTTTPRKRFLGRKGREALARRRALDGAFLTMAIGAVALIWWSTF